MSLAPFQSLGAPRVLTLVRLRPLGVPVRLDAAQQRALFEATAPAYLQVPGLLRKLFLAGDQGAGGWYEWETRAAGEAWFSPAWAERLRSRYAVEPLLEWFEAPCLVDAVAQQVWIAEGPGH
ncbi:MAG: hypothetical protein JNJ71_03370 [Rubrivivax sp.]|nr:hypothetical protein [Rubrivivax sp.]